MISPKTPDGKALEQLGEYRIIREIGRRGMGIVFEAEQESLGSRVALKILPAHALLDDKHLKRFQREVGAAAALHHSNIVPVFGVGESDGIHYYAMQFIRGQGLDQVLTEIRNRRSGFTIVGWIDSAAVKAESNRSDRSDKNSDGAAENLRDSGSRSTADGNLATIASEISNGKDGSEHSESHVLSGSAATSSASGREYYRSVARVGVQVAEVL